VAVDFTVAVAVDVAVAGFVGERALVGDAPLPPTAAVVAVGAEVATLTWAVEVALLPPPQALSTSASARQPTSDTRQCFMLL
jgi:hypothetical protein